MPTKEKYVKLKMVLSNEKDITRKTADTSRQQMNALTGNRTRASRVAGENSTTEPSMLPSYTGNRTRAAWVKARNPNH